ncbi:fic family toxin-antitoxin system, toxin component [Streptomyces sp. NPDC050549]|uniref:fic family toxin-antitoxin system, toxin component n=1 Tax=Streptomyces sp. NPDC050549 TaxID=3155406 RepID=UPI003430E813
MRSSGRPRRRRCDPLYAAAARVDARGMERDLHGSLHLKAAALFQTLAKLPCLEHSDEAFARHATEACLILDERRLDHPSKAVVALVRDTASGELGLPRIARRLREWTTA